MRKFHATLIFAAFAALASISPWSAAAQDWPTRPVTMVIPFAAGSASDTVGRILGARLSELLGQQVIIENVGGAGGMTGVARVAKAIPDGYQIVLGGIDTFAQSQTLYKKPLYNAEVDFEPVALMVEQPLLLVVRNELPVADLKAFIAYTKTNQARMQYGSAGVGSGLASRLRAIQCGGRRRCHPHPLSRLAAGDAGPDRRPDRLFLRARGCGAAAARQQDDEAARHPDARRARRWCRRSRPRTSRASTDFDSNFWSGLFVPKGTPAPVIAKLHAAAVATLDTPIVQERLKNVGVTVVAADRRSPGYLKRFVAPRSRPGRSSSSAAA